MKRKVRFYPVPQKDYVDIKVATGNTVLTDSIKEEEQKINRGYDLDKIEDKAKEYEARLSPISWCLCPKCALQRPATLSACPYCEPEEYMKWVQDRGRERFKR
jgi:hypothetical protein